MNFIINLISETYNYIREKYIYIYIYGDLRILNNYSLK